MSDDAASQLNQLLDSVLDLPPAQRDAWIEALDSRHEPLKPRLRSLLARAANIESRDFLATLPPLPPEADSQAGGGPAETPGQRLGPYQLIRPLGAGGMGTVWLAARADGLFERKLALKLPHRGWFGAGLAERMARERRILAGLDHPNIARLLDAGLTTDGQPFLALEYVEGMPIDEYCRVRALDVTARLRLFLQVTEAVAAAHARLIVHRDLKPANILVTADGVARLLDFGIAKLLDAPTDGAPGLTQLSIQAMTPDYASPEQIRGDEVTTATDIYSLGVILFELLTGERPYRRRNEQRGALEQAILETEPRRPSGVSGHRELRGDLDTIVLKALHKDAPHRYATVAALGDDLRRFLEGHPVLARPDSTWYRTSRFLRRHVLAVSLAGGAVLALLTTTGMALWQARVAQEHERRAADVNRFIKSIFTSADPYEGGGRELRAVELLRQARERIDRELADQPEQRVELLNTLSTSLANLSDYDTAEEVSAAAWRLAAELPADSVARREARTVRLELHRMQGRNAELRREVDALLADPHPDPSAREADRARLLIYAAHSSIDAGDPARAVREASEAQSIAQRVLSAHDSDRLEAAVMLSVAHRYAGDLPRAEQAARQALQWTLEANGGDPDSARVLDARMTLGSIYNDLGRPAAAIAELRAALDAAPRLYGADSRFEMFAHSHLARAHGAAGDFAAALGHIERTLEINSREADEESRNLAMATAIRAHLLLRAGQPAQALEGFDSALPRYRELFGPEHPATLALRVERALSWSSLGRHEPALQELQELNSRHPGLTHWFIVSPAHALGAAQLRAGRAAAALATQRAALAALGTGPRAEFLRMAVLDELGASALAAGDVSQALPALQQALDLHRRLETAVTPARLNTEANLQKARALSSPSANVSG